jgi:hypothetical protein
MIADLLARLAAAGITLELNADNTGFVASPRKAITPALADELRTNKPAIVWYLLCQDWIDGDCSQHVLTCAQQIRAFRAVADDAGIAATWLVVLLYTDAVLRRDQPALGDADHLWRTVQDEHVARIWPDVDIDTPAQLWARTPLPVVDRRLIA